MVGVPEIDTLPETLEAAMDWGRYRNELLTEIARLVEQGGHLKASMTWDTASATVEARDPGTDEAPFRVKVALQNGQVLAGIVREGEGLVAGRPWSTDERSFFARDIHAKFPPGLLNAVEAEVAAHAKSIRIEAAAEASVGALGRAIQDLVERSPGTAGKSVADMLGVMLPEPMVRLLKVDVDAVPAKPGPLMGRMAGLGHADGLAGDTRQIGIRSGGASGDITTGTWQIVDDRGEVLKAIPRSVVQRRPPETFAALLDGARFVYAEGRREGAMDRAMAPGPAAVQDEPEESAGPAFR